METQRVGTCNMRLPTAVLLWLVCCPGTLIEWVTSQEEMLPPHRHAVLSTYVPTPTILPSKLDRFPHSAQPRAHPLLRNARPGPIRRLFWQLPVYGLMVFGCYALAKIGMGLISFKDCSEDAALLDKVSECRDAIGGPVLRRLVGRCPLI